MEAFISMGTSSSGGTFNTLGVAICQMLNDKIPATKFSAQVTGGSGENCIRVGNGEIQIAMAAASSAYEAVNGQGQFKDKAVTNLKVIANLYPAVIQMPVLTSSGIEKLDDIKGKKINIGQAGSGSEATTLSVLEVYGIALSEFSPQQLSHANAADAVIDEKMDGYINLGSLDQSHQMKAMSSGKVKIASLEPSDKIAKLIEAYPYYYEFQIPSGTYPNQDYTVNTVATGTLLITSDEISEDLIYELTKQLFENLEELRKTQSIANDIKLETALNVAGLALHPGAEKYYKEVGIIK
jgi:TRAP transporter TAXI family solute receptor